MSRRLFSVHTRLLRLPGTSVNLEFTACYDTLNSEAKRNLANTREQDEINWKLVCVNYECLIIAIEFSLHRAASFC